MYRELSRYTPPRPPWAGVSQDYVGIILLVSQLKLRSRSYRAIGVWQLYCRKSRFKTTLRDAMNHSSVQTMLFFLSKGGGIQ